MMDKTATVGPRSFFFSKTLTMVSCRYSKGSCARREYCGKLHTVPRIPDSHSCGGSVKLSGFGSKFSACKGSGHGYIKEYGT